MNIFTQIFNQKLAENAKNIRYWEDYVNNLKSLDFTVYADKLRVPALVPIGSRVFFRGELKHTNEVTVALGADYFTKCSLKQAEVLRQHRIKDAQSKVDIFEKEREFLENQLSLRKETVHEEKGQEIIEYQTEEEDREWREKHRENMRKYKQNRGETETEIKEINDKDLWERLEELELQEELENEFLSMKEDSLQNASSPSEIFEDAFMEVISERKHEESVSKREHNQQNRKVRIETNTNISNTRKNETDVSSATSNFKLDLLQQVIDKQNELGQKLQELRNKDQGKSKTEIDLVRKLDEMEELDELEDEMDRLEDLIEGDEYQATEEDLPVAPSKINLKRKVCFADEQEDETLELEFTHTDTESCKDPYETEKGIQKPSDIYAAFSHFFGETTAILKKEKYDSAKSRSTNVTFPVSDESSPSEIKEESKTIVVRELRDVVERTDFNDNILENKSRPTSLFKMRRQQKK